jgi:hypothetical protein
MILAYRQNEGPASIKLLLVGNGWHLVDALSEERREKGPKRVWNEYYEHLLRQLGVADVTLYSDPNLNVPSKHLAAIGALKNVTGGRRRDLDHESEPVKLPAGRELRFGGSSVPWFRLVGNGVLLTDIPAADVRVGNLTVQPTGPALAPSWEHHFAQSFGVQRSSDVPVAAEARIRERLAENLRTTGPTLAVGPLQVIVEDSWLPTLADVR